MMTKEAFQTIKKTFNIKQKQRKKYLSKIWGILLGVLTIITIVLMIVLLPKFHDDDLVLMLFIFMGSIVFALLLGLIFSNVLDSEKPYVEYVNDAVIKRINLNEGLFLKYQAYDKTKEKFHQSGGIFYHHTNIKKYWKLEGISDDNYPFSIYDCLMTTSSGQYQQTHLNGIYMVIEKDVETTIQIRPNGKPRIKGVKYQKSSDYLLYKVYKVEDERLNEQDKKMITLYETLSHQPNHKKVYISVVENEVHIAIWYKKHPARKQKALTLQTVNTLEKYFMDDIKIINQL